MQALLLVQRATAKCTGAVGQSVQVGGDLDGCECKGGGVGACVAAPTMGGGHCTRAIRETNSCALALLCCVKGGGEAGAHCTAQGARICACGARGEVVDAWMIVSALLLAASLYEPMNRQQAMSSAGSGSLATEHGKHSVGAKADAHVHKSPGLDEGRAEHRARGASGTLGGRWEQDGQAAGRPQARSACCGRPDPPHGARAR